jgi:NADPH:quinone reductase-like Zn-dependent oxidoreductase
VRAVRVHEFGGPEVLRLEDVEDPLPGPGQAVVRVRACGLNHLDVDVRSGVSRFPVPLPYTPGYEAVGEIESMGPGVTGWSVGDRVLVFFCTTCGQCALCRSGRQPLCDDLAFVSIDSPGAFAEKVLCSSSQLLRLPDELPFSDAAAVEAAFGTSWHMLFTRAKLQADETVLINSVGSGIASAAVQLAKLAGAYVIGTSSSDEKLERARELGLDAGINYTRTNVAEAVMELTDGRGVDLAYEHVGGYLFQAALDSLAKDGRLVTCGGHGGEVVSFDIIPVFRRQKTVIGSFCYTQDEVARCLDLAARSLIRPLVHRVFSLEAAGEAMAMMERREQFGKIVVEA